MLKITTAGINQKMLGNYKKYFNNRLGDDFLFFCCFSFTTSYKTRLRRFQPSFVFGAKSKYRSVLQR